MDTTGCFKLEKALYISLLMSCINIKNTVHSEGRFQLLGETIDPSIRRPQKKLIIMSDKNNEKDAKKNYFDDASDDEGEEQNQASFGRFSKLVSRDNAIDSNKDHISMFKSASFKFNRKNDDDDRPGESSESTAESKGFFPLHFGGTSAPAAKPAPKPVSSSLSWADAAKMNEKTSEQKASEEPSKNETEKQNHNDYSEDDNGNERQNYRRGRGNYRGKRGRGGNYRGRGGYNGNESREDGENSSRQWHNNRGRSDYRNRGGRGYGRQNTRENGPDSAREGYNRGGRGYSRQNTRENDTGSAREGYNRGGRGGNNMNKTGQRLNNDNKQDEQRDLQEQVPQNTEPVNENIVEQSDGSIHEEDIESGQSEEEKEEMPVGSNDQQNKSKQQPAKRKVDKALDQKKQSQMDKKRNKEKMFSEDFTEKKEEQFIDDLTDLLNKEEDYNPDEIPASLRRSLRLFTDEVSDDMTDADLRAMPELRFDLYSESKKKLTPTTPCVGSLELPEFSAALLIEAFGVNVPESERHMVNRFQIAPTPYRLSFPGPFPISFTKIPSGVLLCFFDTPSVYGVDCKNQLESALNTFRVRGVIKYIIRFVKPGIFNTKFMSELAEKLDTVCVVTTPEIEKSAEKEVIIYILQFRWSEEKKNLANQLIKEKYENALMAKCSVCGNMFDEKHNTECVRTFHAGEQKALDGTAMVKTEDGKNYVFYECCGKIEEDAPGCQEERFETHTRESRVSKIQAYLYHDELMVTK